MARMGYIKNKSSGFLDLLIIPQTGLETESVFTLVHTDNYPLEISGRIEFDGDSSPRIIIYGNNVQRKEEPNE